MKAARAWAAAILALTLTASFPVSAQESETLGQPDGERAAQASLPQSHDAIWAKLKTTKIGEDPKLGLFTAQHSAQVKALAGQTLTITGFVLPLETDEQLRHFLLTKNTPVCPFCPPGTPNEVVEVWTDAPVSDTYDMVSVTGVFGLADNGDQGLFFKLEGAALSVAAAGQ